MSVVKKPLYEPGVPKVYKTSKLNNANFGDFSLTDYQVFLHLVSKIGGVDWEGKYLQSETLDREHQLKATDLIEVFNTDPSNSYKILRKACKKLMQTSITVEKTEQQELWEINVCSTAKYNKGKGIVTVEFTDRIMPYLAQVKERFLLYNLKEISNFQSLYSTRLYELIQEFKDTGWMLKSLEQLRDSFAVGSKFKAYKDFKRCTFEHACKEINSLYKMGLHFTEIKEGRKVVAVKFFFKKTNVKKVTNKKTGRTRNLYDKPKVAIKPKRRSPSKLKTETIIVEGKMESQEQKPNMDRKPRSVSNVLSSMFPNIFSKKK